MVFLTFYKRGGGVDNPHPLPLLPHSPRPRTRRFHDSITRPATACLIHALTTLSANEHISSSVGLAINWRPLAGAAIFSDIHHYHFDASNREITEQAVYTT